MVLTKREVDVLFHILNNMHGSSADEAVERAKLADDISKEQFYLAHRQLLSKIVNYEVD